MQIDRSSNGEKRKTSKYDAALLLYFGPDEYLGGNGLVTLDLGIKEGLATTTSRGMETRPGGEYLSRRGYFAREGDLGDIS